MRHTTRAARLPSLPCTPIPPPPHTWLYLVLSFWDPSLALRALASAAAAAAAAAAPDFFFWSASAFVLAARRALTWEACMGREVRGVRPVLPLPHV